VPETAPTLVSRRDGRGFPRRDVGLVPNVTN
jgi:hypothetical protein